MSINMVCPNCGEVIEIVESEWKSSPLGRIPSEGDYGRCMMCYHCFKIVPDGLIGVPSKEAIEWGKLEHR